MILSLGQIDFGSVVQQELDDFRVTVVLDGKRQWGITDFRIYVGSSVQQGLDDSRVAVIPGSCL